MVLFAEEVFIASLDLTKKSRIHLAWDQNSAKQL